MKRLLEIAHKEAQSFITVYIQYTQADLCKLAGRPMLGITFAIIVIFCIRTRVVAIGLPNRRHSSLQISIHACMPYVI